VTSAVIGVVVVTLAVAAVLNARGASGPVVKTPEASSASGEIVAETTRANLVVLSARTGRVVRTLVTDVGVGAPFSVSPDGSTLFFGQPSAPAYSCPGREVAAVPISGGTPQVVASAATQPAVSPDGHHLAYLSYLGPNGCTPPPQKLVIVPLSRRTMTASQWTVPQGGQSLAQLSWAPDSRHLAYVLYDVNSGSYPRVLDTQVPGASLAGAPYPQSDATGWYGYLGDTGEFLGLYQPGPDQQHSPEVVALDPSTGAIRRRLVTLDGLTGVDALTSDPTGRHLLVVATRPGASPSQSQNLGLYQWNEGERHVTLVATGILAATWIPTSHHTR
jgi:Tol biopolymer transport system component